MKYTFLPILALFFSISTLFGQNAKAKAPVNPEWDKLAREATVTLTEKYSLNADQAKQMYTVQLRKQRNMASIESLKTSNAVQYRTKLEGLQQGTLNSIRRLLQTKGQVEIFNNTKKSLRAKKSELRKNMMAKQATQAEMDAALLNLFEE